MAPRRDIGRLRLLPARSIEETGLDPSLLTPFLSPQGAQSPVKESWSTYALPTAESTTVKDSRFANHLGSLPCAKYHHQENTEVATAPDMMHTEELVKSSSYGNLIPMRTVNINNGPDEEKEGTAVNEERANLKTCISQKRVWKSTGGFLPRVFETSDASQMSNDQDFVQHMNPSLEHNTMKGTDSTFDKPSTTGRPTSSTLTFHSATICRTSDAGEESEQFFDALDVNWNAMDRSDDVLRHISVSDSKNSTSFNGDPAPNECSSSSTSNKLDARSRWKRAGHSVKFINHLASNIRAASTDLIEDKAVDEIMQQKFAQGDAGRVGAAAFEGAQTVARSRSKGRKGMEGLVVKQDRGLVTFFQDFYVACLKMPIGYFLVGVFTAPLALGLFFTPLYLLDVDGLSFNGIVPEDATTSPLASAGQRCLAFLNIFLYALSLSTTFGGAPIAARSPFCLLVANVNTLLAQFLFVFLSGAVFARMSQPSYPIRCSKKAIIKTDDLLPVLGVEQQEKFKVFAIRLVLTGPSPCELVDAKICLTFRIFVTLPSGSVFCSTQDLEVVRPEVSYLRYGIMVRHIIDRKSPVYGHTVESLREGDASFSLTVMGLERTSMQPVFHLEDYFVNDHDVIWDGDYEDFIHVDDKGRRILDHSRIDHLKPMKAAAMASQAIARMKRFSQQKHEENDDRNSTAFQEFEKEPQSPWSRNWFGLRKRKLLKSMSTSFTRADW
ncbi:hypothetical protein KP509_15G054900 [Ceratopteris richardii]|uniref:Inward rectifier potassium channel C-terminal domain-containing protein n=1 Tax=Ceratopteris richardii TaxID=49495 RepID=A0A8T2T3J6_CERRI|nr:hypothetical protein KP509_15G054900 [Ceratopteris richardii]KAH7405052.1 hypothetical protein KP509_15G054900 [Ceratopteris richardii]KAH7405053.1 hypothetical protein KP509_15G054900 [Ceratopteris richardii]